MSLNWLRKFWDWPPPSAPAPTRRYRMLGWERQADGSYHAEGSVVAGRQKTWERTWPDGSVTKHTSFHAAIGSPLPEPLKPLLMESTTPATEGIVKAEESAQD